MEDTEPLKEWFVTHDGKQFGPVSMEDLKFEAERGELNPRLDMVWKNGMEDWIPAGEVEGLFKRNDEAKAAEEAKQAAFTEYKPDISEEEKKLIRGEWTGAGRGTYFFVIFIFPVIFGMGIGAFTVAVRSKVEPAMLENISSGFLLVFLIISILVVLKRFQNLGMSRWWFIASFAPFLNLWLSYRLFACPPGYAYHKKLDPLGWVLAILHWGSLLIVVAAFGFAAYMLTQAGEDDPTRIAIEKYIEEARKAQEKR